LVSTLRMRRYRYCKIFLQFEMYSYNVRPAQ